MDKRPTIQLISRLGGLIFLLFSAVLLAPEFYRWRDQQGGHHYADKPPSGGTDVEKIAVDGGSGFYRVARVYDGDTVLLDGGEKVRLIGINTPELAYRNRPGEPGGERAGHYLRRLISGQLVRLEYGRERRDKYGRLLAHLFTRKGRNINALMLSKGYAHAVIKPPNIRMLQHYMDAEKGARDAHRGIWKLPQFRLHKITDAATFRNTFRRLQGVVKRVEERRSAWLLTFDGGVKGRIGKGDLDSFIGDGMHPNTLAGKRLTIRGWVHLSRGKPLITLRNSKAIESVD